MEDYGQRHVLSYKERKQLDEAVKSFPWKRLSKMGGYKARFRFFDVGRGESFFDQEFQIGAKSQPGMMSINRLDTGILKALSPGTTVTVIPTWISPRGRKEFSFTAKIQKVGSPDEFGWVPVNYTQDLKEEDDPRTEKRSRCPKCSRISNRQSLSLDGKIKCSNCGNVEGMEIEEASSNQALKDLNDLHLLIMDNINEFATAFQTMLDSGDMKTLKVIDKKIRDLDSSLRGLV